MRKPVKLLVTVFAVIAVVLSISIGCFATETSRFVDEAGLFTYDEALELNSYLDEVSVENNFDVVAVFVSDMGDYGYSDITEFADDYYDKNGYGYGAENDGVILAVSLAGRDYWISTCGYGITAITDYGISKLEDDFVSYLSDGGYSQAVKRFASSSIELVQMAKNDEVYDDYGSKDYYTYGKETNVKVSFNWGSHIFIALVIGIIAGVIVASIMKGSLTSVGLQKSAGNYFVPGSLNMSSSNDVFLYANVAAVPKPKDPPQQTHSGGGSSVHVSSGGVSHGGGGGKF